MPQVPPYLFIACPCADRLDVPSEDLTYLPSPTKRLSSCGEAAPSESPFDFGQPRSNFSLFPPEHLLYCEECRVIKCPRCITEEQVCYFCTSCLFETPSTAAASEGFRCLRNCFDCPICFSQLAVNSINGSAKDGPWILHCNYCTWTSLDIGIKLDKPTNIRAQLDKISWDKKIKPNLDSPGTSASPRLSSRLGDECFLKSNKADRRQSSGTKSVKHTTSTPNPAMRFNALKSFYKTELTNISNDTDSSYIPGLGTSSFSSPASLTRILSMYSTSGSFLPSKRNTKSAHMREAIGNADGFKLAEPEQFSTCRSRLYQGGLMATASLEQQHFQTSPCGGNANARFVNELLPMPTRLTTKKAKRCKDCKHILAKPEVRPTSTRYRIRLLASSYIPSVSLRPLSRNLPTSESPIRSETRYVGQSHVLQAGKLCQLVLTMKNPLFDKVQVSLATPSEVFGKSGYQVTILCPQFELGTSGDVWDQALNEKEQVKGTGTIRSNCFSSGEVGVAEAGKVYEKGQNWTSVVLELVPGLTINRTNIADNTEHADSMDQILCEPDPPTKNFSDDVEDVFEIPIHVRLEWKQGLGDDKGPSSRIHHQNHDKDDGTCELSYWMVLGVGKIRK